MGLRLAALQRFVFSIGTAGDARLAPRASYAFDGDEWSLRAERQRPFANTRGPLERRILVGSGGPDQGVTKA